MKHLEHIASGIDTSEVRAVLERWPKLMTGESLPLNAREIEAGTMAGEHTLNGGPLPVWEVLWLRWPVDTWNATDCLEFEPPIAASAYWARNTLRTVASLVGAGELGRIHLVRLKAGGRVPPHVDVGIYSDHFSRFHLVLTSDPRCLFTAGSETVHMAPGELWWFDHGAVHSVTNGGPDRIHLIFDAVAPAYSARLTRAEAAV